MWAYVPASEQTSNLKAQPHMSTAPSPCLANTLPGAILQTIIARLATLFLAGADGDMTEAAHAAYTTARQASR